MQHKDSTLSGFAVLLPFLIIAAVSFLSYSNTFHVPFQLDDSLNISEKPYVRDIGGFFDPAKIEYYRTDSPYRMRTVAYFTFAANYRLHGNDVVGYHVVNLAIHLINGFLVYFLLLLTFRTPYFSNPTHPGGKVTPPPSALPLKVRANSRPGAAEGRGSYDPRGSAGSFISLFAALLFVSHPIQTQAVTYIVQRLASLATLFYLLSLVMFIKWRVGAYRDTPLQAGTRNPKSGWRSTVWYLSSLVFAVLAMKTKEIAFTLPLIIALYEFLFFEGALKKRILYLAPFMLTLLIIPLELMGLEKPAGAVMGEMNSALRASSDLSRWDYLFTQFRVIVTYIRLLLFPVNQNLDYDFPVYHSFFDPNVILSFLFLSALFGTGVYLLYKSRVTAPGKVTPPLSAPPLKIRANSRPDGAEGRGSYDPKGGEEWSLYRLVAFGIFWFFITLSVESSVIPIADVIFEHRLYLSSVGFFIGATAALSLLWQRANGSRKLPSKIALAVCGLSIVVLSGATYARNSQWKDEVGLWKDVVKKSPLKVRPRINLGHFYGKQGRLEEALAEYQTALRLDPDDFQVHNNLGVIYKAQGRAEEAIREYRTALRLNPGDSKAYYNLGNIFREQGDFEEAIKHYQTAIRLETESEIVWQSDRAVIHNNLGIAFIGQGNKEAAEREFRTAIGLDPGYEAAEKNLEMLRGSTGHNPLGLK